jgi:hypothetical protein
VSCFDSQVAALAISDERVLSEFAWITADQRVVSPMVIHPHRRPAWQTSDDLYAVLGIHPQADAPTITAAYRALVRRYHPDVSPVADAAERLRVLNSAYAVLRNPKTRRAYDTTHGYAVLVPEPPARTWREHWAAVVRWMRQPVFVWR